MIDYTVQLLSRNDLTNSRFHLDRHDHTRGFTFDATHFCGPTYPEHHDDGASKEEEWFSPLQTRLRVASHLAGYLRGRLESQRGFTSSVGISTCKLLAKLAGSVHKPNSQTALLAPYSSSTGQDDGNVTTFLDAHEIRKIPGIGSKMAQKLTAHLVGDHSSSPPLTVHDLRMAPGMGPVILENILGGPGAPKNIGVKMWSLIHGVDDSPVMEARDVPTQISIEDSFPGRLDTMENVKKALLLLSTSLIRRMRIDLTESSRWVAHPRTLRLSTRAKANMNMNNRISRSAPLPQFIFNLDEKIEAVAERLVQESLALVFRKLHPERSTWKNLSLLNVAVTNMVESAGERKSSSGRDIGNMFTGLLSSSISTATTTTTTSTSTSTATASMWEESDEDEPMPSETCGVCGASIPYFARAAHSRYHLVSSDF